MDTGTERPSRKHAWLGLALAVGVAFGGCTEDSPTDLTDVTVVQASKVGGGPGVIARVKGGGHYQLKDPPGFVGDFKWIYHFSVNARKLADGTDEGTIKARSKLPPGRNEAGASLDWWMEIEVDCVEIEGNTAWLTGPIVAAGTTSPFGPAVGPGPAILIIQDNGPNGNDEVNVGPAAFYGAADCRDKPPISSDAATDGNFTISSMP